MVSPLPAAHGNVSVLSQNHLDSIQSQPLAMQWHFFFLEKPAKVLSFIGVQLWPQCSSWIWGKTKSLAPSAAPAPRWVPMEEPGVTCPMALELGDCSSDLKQKLYPSSDFLKSWGISIRNYAAICYRGQRRNSTGLACSSILPPLPQLAVCLVENTLETYKLCRRY